jgi:hypothetical protein
MTQNDTFTSYVQAKILSLYTGLLLIFYLGTSGCPGGNWDRGLMDLCFSLH